MTEQDQPLTDDELVTDGPTATSNLATGGDADGTDGDSTDGTDGDSHDSDGTDGGDSDGTDA